MFDHLSHFAWHRDDVGPVGPKFDNIHNINNIKQLWIVRNGNRPQYVKAGSAEIIELLRSRPLISSCPDFSILRKEARIPFYRLSTIDYVLFLGRFKWEDLSCCRQYISIETMPERCLTFLETC
jgi:hypothetical protein